MPWQYGAIEVVGPSRRLLGATHSGPANTFKACDKDCCNAPGKNRFVRQICPVGFTWKKDIDHNKNGIIACSWYCKCDQCFGCTVEEAKGVNVWVGFQSSSGSLDNQDKVAQDFVTKRSSIVRAEYSHCSEKDDEDKAVRSSLVTSSSQRSLMGGSHIQILPDTTNPKAHRVYWADGAVMHSEYAHVRSTPNSWFKAAIAAGREEKHVLSAKSSHGSKTWGSRLEELITENISKPWKAYGVVAQTKIRKCSDDPHCRGKISFRERLRIGNGELERLDVERATYVATVDFNGGCCPRS